MSQGLVLDESLMNEPVCSVCKQEIDDSVHRVIIFQDTDKNPVVKRFHFFFPCWDLEQICKNEMGYKIVNAGLSCEESILTDSKKLRQLQRNSSLWE